MNFRVKNFLVSILFPFIFVLFLRSVSFGGFLLYGTIFVGMLILYFLSFWLYSYNIYPLGYITVLLLPVLFFGAFAVIYFYFILNLNILVQLMILGGFLIMQYYLASTQNILNISHFKSISLAQAANTTNNFYTVLTFFISSVALFIVPDINNLVRLGFSVILFALMLLIFITLHSIDRLQFIFSVFIYTTFILIIAILYVFNFIQADKIVLLPIVLSLFFRDFLILLHYSARKVLSLYDYLQIILEMGIIIFIIDFASK